MLHIPVLLQIRADGSAVFITLQVGELRLSLAIVLPASTDLIKGNMRPSEREAVKICQCCVNLAVAF